jgi:hypothetical protein
MQYDSKVGGRVNLRGLTNCVDCNAHLRPRVDYGSLTDALVWTYLFEELCLPLTCNNANVSFVDVVAILPAVRMCCAVNVSSASNRTSRSGTKE